MDIVLFGIQGSGKGTLGKLVAEKYGYSIFETGGELRKLSKEESPLGKKVKSIIEAGHLVPTEVVMEIVENFMQNLPAGTEALIDGIPRKIDQAEAFDTLMKKLNRNFKGILIEVSKDAALKRLSTRRICEKCKAVYPANYTKDNCEKCGGNLITRSDDNPESIKTRLQAFFDETMPVIERYKTANKMISMNGEISIEEARDQIFEVISKIKSN